MPKGYRISADQLVDEHKGKPIIKTCLSSDIALGGGFPLGGTVLISAPPKFGKAQPLSAKVLTPYGWIYMRDIKVGDKAIGSDRQPHNVTGVYPQGIKQIFTVHLFNGKKTECCDEHFWTVSDTSLGKKIKVVDTRFLIEAIEKGECWYVPVLQKKKIQWSKIWSIEKLPYVEECQCISVESPDNLYVTDCNILTHNTSYILDVCAAAQRQFGTKTFFFPAEGRFTSKILNNVHGLKRDIDHFEIVRPEPIYGDKKEIIGFKKWDAEQWWDAMGECIEMNPGCIMVLDSLSQLSPSAENNEEMGKQLRGRQQQLEAQFCRKYGDLIIANNILFFAIAQIQANTSGYGFAQLPKAGNAFKHQADAILAAKGSPEAITEGDKRVGHKITFEVQNSPLGSPYTSMTIPIKYGYGVDYDLDVITYAKDLGIIKGKGAWYSIPFVEESTEYKENGDDLKKLQGEAQLKNWFSVNPEQLKIIETKVRELLVA